MNACNDNKCNDSVIMNYTESLLRNSLQHLYVYNVSQQCPIELETHTYSCIQTRQSCEYCVEVAIIRNRE